MKKKLFVMFLTVIMMVSALTVPVRPVSVQAAQRMTDEEWRKSKTGSAGVLEGRAVIVSIFVNDANGKWTKKAKKKANRKMNVAGRYIRTQAKKYGKTVRLVTDIYENKDISYSYTTKKKLTDGTKSQDQLYRSIEKWMNGNIDLTKIRESHHTDNIGFVFHINKSGNSSTLIHYMEDEGKNFYECSTLFSKFEGEEESAATYAHEMLHLFGARDLYMKSLADGITSSFVKYVAKKFSNDIMYTTYASNGKQYIYSIKNDISRVTAYFLGWKTKIPEQKKYAICVKEKGCFSDGTSFPS